MNEFDQPKLSSRLALLVILLVFNGSAKRIAAGAEPAAKSVEGVSEESQDAIVELAEAGVQVLLGKYEVNGRQWIDDDEETDWEEVEEDAARKLVRATFRTPGASVSEPGFRATFTRKALAQLLRNLPDLASADLRGTNVTDDHLKQLSNCASLKYLDLADTTVGDAGLAHLRGMKNLRGLDLRGTRTTDAGLKNFTRSLRELNLADTSVSDAGLVHLTDLSLRRLCLERTAVTDAGLVHFKGGLSKLHELDLTDTKVTKAGVDQLFRDVPSLRDRREHGTIYTRVSWGSTLSSNPTTIEVATTQQIARLKQVLWWLPDDSESLEVAHGRFAFRSLDERLPDRVSTVCLFQRFTRPAIDLMGLDTGALDDRSVALVMRAGRRFHFRPIGPLGEMTSERCHIIIFERPLDDAGDSFKTAVAERAVKIDMIRGIDVAQIEAGAWDLHWTSFIAQPAADVLLVGNNREFVAEVLARMEKRGEARAFDEELPEWKHVELRSRQWAMRRFVQPPKRRPNWPFRAFVYCVQSGDVAKVAYLFDTAHSAQAERWSWPIHGVKVRQEDPNSIEVNVDVSKKQALIDFFTMLFSDLSL